MTSFTHTHAQTAHHVEEECVMGTLNSSVQVSIRADDAGGLAPQLQGHRLDPLGRLLHDDLAHLCASSEGNLVNACSVSITTLVQIVLSLLMLNKSKYAFQLMMS